MNPLAASTDAQVKSPEYITAKLIRNDTKNLYSLFPQKVDIDLVAQEEEEKKKNRVVIDLVEDECAPTQQPASGLCSEDEDENGEEMIMDEEEGSFHSDDNEDNDDDDAPVFNPQVWPPLAQAGGQTANGEFNREIAYQNRNMMLKRQRELRDEQEFDGLSQPRFLNLPDLDEYFSQWPNLEDFSIIAMCRTFANAKAQKMRVANSLLGGSKATASSAPKKNKTQK